MHGRMVSMVGHCKRMRWHAHARAKVGLAKSLIDAIAS